MSDIHNYMDMEDEEEIARALEASMVEQARLQSLESFRHAQEAADKELAQRLQEAADKEPDDEFNSSHQLDVSGVTQPAQDCNEGSWDCPEGTLSMPRTINFEVSYERSQFLKDVDFLHSAEVCLAENMWRSVKLVTLGSTPIRYITDLWGAKHEYVIIGMGHDPVNNFTKRGNTEYKKHAFVLIEFSKNMDSHNRCSGIINLTSFYINMKAQESLQQGFERKAEMKSINAQCYGQPCKELNLSDVLCMAAALASKGYNIEHNNCRHFARGLSESIRQGKAVPGVDVGQRNLRRIANCLDAHGYGSIARSSPGSSFAAKIVAVELLKVAFLEATIPGVNIAMNLALLTSDPGAWQTVLDTISHSTDQSLMNVRNYI